MSFSVVLRRLAERDLEEIQDWYELQRDGLGSAFRASVDEAVARIAENPFLYADMYRGNRRVLLRRFKYALWYRVQGELVVVLCCVHGRRGDRYIRRRLRRGA